MLDFLRKEGISENLINEIDKFRKFYKLDMDMNYRIPNPKYYYFGKDVWEQAITALICGENLLLVGPKATGKNVLSQNLAMAFGRPSWDISFYVNTDSSTLIGTDTFENGKVTFRHGPIYECAVKGGFGILDEINMAKNESLAVLHATLDFRRIIDVPGYDKIKLDDATRFIATMNYGYAGTRELNEALASRFMVIEMPSISSDNLKKLLQREFPNLKNTYLEQFTGLFQDLQKKNENSEIS
ncbi:MAG TPA: ATPase, partial [Clostridiales bacterium]|nr:ATPase [Clostridiales bacterium]